MYSNPASFVLCSNTSSNALLSNIGIPVTCRHTSREDVTDGMSTLIQVFNNDFDHTVVHAPLICKCY